MSRRPRVCIVLEGSYPFITGGVSAWVQDLIQGLPDVDFCLMTISPEANQSLRYKLPPNVVEHRDIVLGGKRPTRAFSQADRRRAVSAILAAHGRMFADEAPDLASFFKSLPVGYDPGADAADDKRAWELLGHMNQKRNPAYPFSDYFWSWQSAHGLLFEALSAEPPDADLYHAVSTGFAGLVALAARERLGKPFFLTEHGLYHKEREIEIRKAGFVRGYQRDMWIKTYNRISKLCYGRADRISSLFEENRQKQIELGAPPAACVVIQNGIDVERFSAVERKPRPGFHVGLVGRIVPIKDVKTFIAAAKLVLDAVPEARFYAIGPTDEDPDYYEECVALAASLNLGERFAFTGRQDVREYYAFLDLMLLTSVREAQPLVVLEGWAAGVQSVCTKVGNAPEMLDFDERFLAPSKDPVKLASAVLYAHAHPAEMAALSERNRRKVAELYNKRDMLRKYREVYEDLGAGAWRA